MTIGELSRVSGVSVRTLRHYDAIGLLKPCATTEAGYRQYDNDTLERLSLILFFRELKFPLREIGRMLDSTDFDLVAVLDRQIAELEEKRRHIDNLILLARGVWMRGLNHLRFSAFDLEKLDDVAARAADTWQDTPEWRESQRRAAELSPEERERQGQDFMALIASFGHHPEDPACPEAQAMVQSLRDYITAHFYDCRLPLLQGMANLYDGGGEFTRNIDRAAGTGTAAFLAQAMRVYCDNHKK